MTLRLRNLSLASPLSAHPVLERVDLDIPRGAVTGLCGGSGAGKSLIAAALVGQLPRGMVQSGSIICEGAGRIAMAPQSLEALDPLASVAQQLRRFARLCPDPAAPEALLARVGLPDAYLAYHPHQLSGGQARRVLLATALATGAEFIIADEPTAGLDGEQAARIMALLADFAARGHGVLVISHDLPLLAGIADRVAVLRQGRLVEIAAACAFSAQGAALTQAYTRALWRAQAA